MKLDFSQATVVEQGYLLIPEPASDLKKFSDIYDRLSSIIYHSAKVGGESTNGRLSKLAKNATHIRAALCEFVGIEDLMKQIYPSIEKTKYCLYKSSNPTFHMIKLLRNYNIHISNSQLDQKSMKVRTLVEEHGEFDINVEFISNLSPRELRKMKCTKDYSDFQLDCMINKFDLQQHKFGVSTLIIKAAIDYSEHLANVLHESVESS